MYSTGVINRSPPQSRSISPWYTLFPGLNPADDYSPSWPPPMLEIADRQLRRIALLPKTGRSPPDPIDVQHNHRAEYLGEGILMTLISDFLYTEFIEYGVDGLLAMRQALLDDAVLSNICQRIDLPRLHDRHMDEQSLALLFESYIGGLYHDRGAEGYPELRRWFHRLIKPYAMMCKHNYDQYVDSGHASRSSHFMSPSRNAGYGSTGYSSYGFVDPSTIARPGTAAPDLGRYAPSYGGTRGSGDYITELKEYCEKKHWAAPVYYDIDNEDVGDFILWRSTVTIDGNPVGESPDWAKSKKLARATASKVALNHLRS